MKGNQHISDVIHSIDVFKRDKINFIEAMTSQGKTTFCLNKLRSWISAPEKMLYLIDTSNGEAAITRNDDTVQRRDFQYDNIEIVKAGTISSWGENLFNTGKTPVMTYAGFGKALHDVEYKDFWKHFEVVVCDEVQNLFNYQKIGDDNKNLEAAENTLRRLAVDTNTLVIAISATPKAAWNGFKEYKLPDLPYSVDILYNVPFDRENLVLFEDEKTEIVKLPEEAIKNELLKGHRGVVYTEHVTQMKKFIAFAKSLGKRADGFWSINSKEHLMDSSQYSLREYVLENERMPDDLDLLVINAASLTCIKLKNPIDFMFINTNDTDDRIQARGRVCGDLSAVYFPVSQVKPELPADFDDAVLADYLDRPLAKADYDELCEKIGLWDAKNKTFYKWKSIRLLLEKRGYIITQSRTNARRWIIKAPKEINLSRGAESVVPTLLVSPIFCHF